MYLLAHVLICCKSTDRYMSGDINPRQIPAPSASHCFYSQCLQVSWMLEKKSLLTTLLHKTHIMWSLYFVLKNNCYRMFCYHQHWITFYLRLEHKVSENPSIWRKMPRIFIIIRNAIRGTNLYDTWWKSVTRVPPSSPLTCKHHLGCVRSWDLLPS